jgi:hypothetical protein
MLIWKAESPRSNYGKGESKLEAIIAKRLNQPLTSFLQRYDRRLYAIDSMPPLGRLTD